MRKSLFFIVFAFCSFTLTAQRTGNQIVEGDIVILGEPFSSDYTNIDFPRKSSIYKRGAIPNFKALTGKKLVVKKVETNTKGDLVATLERKDGLNFFRFFPSVKANLSSALESRELMVLK